MLHVSCRSEANHVIRSDFHCAQCSHEYLGTSIYDVHTVSAIFDSHLPLSILALTPPLPLWTSTKFCQVKKLAFVKTDSDHDIYEINLDMG